MRNRLEDFLSRLANIRPLRLRRLRRAIKLDDPEIIEAARDWVRPQDIPSLMAYYWKLQDWSLKRAVVELLQDQSHPDLPKLMLDFLRVPLKPGDERTELAQAIALGFIDEQYDRFTAYYNNRDLLAQDVRTALRKHALQPEQPPATQSVPRVQPAYDIPLTLPANQRLLMGINYGDLSTVRHALQDGASINAIVGGGTYYGCSMLMLAIAQERFDIAEFLIRQGADIYFTRCDLQGNFDPQRGQTALWWAACHGHLPLAQELVERGADVNTADHHGATPLIRAAQQGHLEMVQYLVGQGADTHARISDGRNALHLAVTNGHLSVAEYLLDIGNDPNEMDGNGYTPLMVAVENNHYDLACLLIQRGADVNAAHAGNGIYIGLRGWTPLVFAVHAGLTRMTKLLIESGANVHYRVPAGRRWDNVPLPERSLLDFAKGKRTASIAQLIQGARQKRH